MCHQASQGSKLYIQNWYADDSSCLGRLLRIKEWFLSLLEQGPAFGYFAEPSKSIVIVKPHHGEAAKTIFGNLNVQVTTSGRFLGSYIGDPEGVSSFVRSRVSDWVDGVNCLAKAAKAYPQSAHSAFTRSLSCEWTYLQRVLEGNETEYTPLRDTIRHVFAPSLLGREVLDVEQDLLALPAKVGGLGLANPVTSAPDAHATSKRATEILQVAICTGAPVDMAHHIGQCRQVTSEVSRARDLQMTERSKVLRAALPRRQQRTLNRIVDGNASGWLTVLPLKQEGYDMSAVQFRDQLAIRYGQEPNAVPSHCDGCGAAFSLQHSLDCMNGGLIKRGHNDVRDVDARLADVAWGGVAVEPVMVPVQDGNNRPTLQADWLVRGVWEGDRVAYFDNRIVDADAPSYVRSNLSWNAVSNSAASFKKRKYKAAAEELRASFTPLVCSTDGALHTEYRAYQRRLAMRLASRWDKSYSNVMSWVPVRIHHQFAVFRAVDFRLRGSRRRLGGLAICDGVGLGVGR